MRDRRTQPKPDRSAIDEALDAMDADGLRSVIREMLAGCDDALRARLAGAVLDRAARRMSGWAPAGPTATTIREILAFADSAKRVGHADPAEVDACLREGSNAFLARDYPAALQIFRALLIPVRDVDIDLGQDEMVDEVLGVDAGECASQYVLSMYMTSAPKNRAAAVLSAIDEMRGIGYFWEPLRQLERVAVEPLPGLDEFLKQWKALVEQRAKKNRDSEWDSDEDRWLREVVQRSEGADGLAVIARASKRADDLRAWCRALVETGDWTAALGAYDEAAEIVADKEYARGEFLDGAALAAQELQRRDFPARLERAWHEAPSVVRLRRWLGVSASKKVLRRRVDDALTRCPKQAQRQRALLHVLNGDFAAAAKLLSSAKGLGWSGGDHPGHLLFPLVAKMLGGPELPDPPVRDLDELSVLAEPEGPRVRAPEMADLIALGGVRPPRDATTREKMVKAMRSAARKRITGVTENKRRRHYAHAASLALACTVVDGHVGGTKWFEGIRDEYRRYPALQRELERLARRR